MTTFSETSLPALIFSVPAGHPQGTADALGRLTINEAQGVPQSWLVWGMETNDRYAHTNSLGSGALFYEAESRTLLSGSTVATLAGASSGSVVQSGTLPTFDVPIVSTQATGSGAHLTHVGTFRVFARVMSTTTVSAGTVTFGLQWAVGDFASYTSNATVTLPTEAANVFRLYDMGIVSVQKPTTGPQRWEGRIVGHASSGDTLRVDCFVLVPVDLGSGEAAITTQAPSAAGPVIYDLFDQTVGALTGKTTSSGGAVWTLFGGDADDWAIDTNNHIATRSAISDAGGGGALNAGRHITAGTAAYTTFTATVDVLYSVTPVASNVTQTGITFRAADTNNFGRIVVTYPAAIGIPFLRYYRRITGSVFSSTSGLPGSGTSIEFGSGTWYTLTLSVDTKGLIRAWWNSRGASLGSPIFAFTDANFASGGPLASGKIGLYDDNESAVVFNRSVDNFSITTPATIQDAVMFGGQSAQVRHDGVIREDSTGTFWQPVSSYNGDLLKVPASGREGRSIRFVVKASRSIPGAGPDSAIDDINATLALTPRYLGVPIGGFFEEAAVVPPTPPGPTAPVNTAVPVLSGQSMQAQTVSTTTGTWSGTVTITYTYQWQNSPTGSVWTNIGGATSQAYVIQAGDIGKVLRAVVTATNSVGSATANSAASAVITASGTPFVRDSFTGTTGVTIESRAGEIGTNLWTKHSASTGSGSDVIQSNRAMGPLGSGTNIYYASATPPTADYEVTALIIELSDNSSSHLEVAGRMSTTLNTMYYVSYNSSSNACTLSVIVAGTVTTLASAFMLATSSLTLRMVGDQISGLVDGVLVFGPVTNSTITTVGRAGFRHGGFNNTGAGIHVDNIEALAL